MDEEFKHDVEPKKRHTGLLVVLMLILGLAIGVGGSYYYFKVYNKSTTSSTTKSTKNSTTTLTETKLNPDGIYVKDLVGRYDHAMISNYTVAEVLYKKDETNISDITDSYLKATIVNNIIGSYQSFTSTAFQDSKTKLYGSALTITDQSFEYGCGNYNYDSTGKYYSYKEGTGCGGTSNASMIRKIVSAIKSADEKTLTVTIAYALENNEAIYKDLDLKEKIENATPDSFDIDTNYKDLNQYQYNFAYDTTNNNYYLLNITKVGSND